MKNSQTGNDAAPTAVSAEEMQHRQEALNYAVASVGLEGLPVSEVYMKEAQRWVRGEIDDEALTAAMLSIAKDIL
jgi:hypothetical protein